MRKFSYIVLFTVILFTACSEYPEMEEDILLFHVLREQEIELDNDEDEYVNVIAKSFGMDAKLVRKIQKAVLSKESLPNDLMVTIRRDFDAALYAKTKELFNKNGEQARKDFVVNVMAPYLNALSADDFYHSGTSLKAYEGDICALYGKFFDEPDKDNSLKRFIDIVNHYNNVGRVTGLDNLDRLNAHLFGYNLFVEWNVQRNVNVLQIDDVFPSIPYKRDSILILGVKRIVPGLYIRKKGYTNGSNRVIVLDDMVKFESEENIAEVEQNRFFSRYEDKRFERYWHSIRLDLNVEKASKVYNSLMKKDFLGKPKKFVKQSLSMEIAVREAKRLADRMDLSTMDYLDGEFSAYIASAIFNPAPNVTMLSALHRMERCGVFNHHPVWDDMTHKFWKIARRSAFEEAYSNDSLRQDLLRLYCDYRTVREQVSLNPLADFYNQVVLKVAEHYGLADSVSIKLLDCQDLPPLPLPESRPQVNFPASQVKFGIPEVKVEEENAQ